MANNPAFNRPYKTRQQRRQADKRKTDDANEGRFLLKVAGGVLLVILLIVVFIMKGQADRDSAAPQRISAAE